MRKWVLALLIALGCFTTASHGEVIVVAVSGTDAFEPGQRLDGTEPITLAEGARITLLSKAGEMQVISGAVENVALSKTGEVSENQAMSNWNTVKVALGQPDARTEVFGASRNLSGDAPTAPGVWHVSVDSSGPRCTIPTKLVLWRRDAKTSQEVSVRSASGSVRGLAWDEGESLLTLPSSFEIESGKMIVGMGGKLRDFEVHVAPASLSAAGPGAVLGWLVEKKCNRQASALIEHVHKNVDFE
ncbi:MAG: hypothetical protein QNJ29_01500 [Rhizobiaceae bacterium]|nr:hypothetical protein [Rhizobiaceae bacterium]